MAHGVVAGSHAALTAAFAFPYNTFNNQYTYWVRSSLV